MMIRTFDKMTDEKKDAHLKLAKQTIKNLK